MRRPTDRSPNEKQFRCLVLVNTLLASGQHPSSLDGVSTATRRSCLDNGWLIWKTHERRQWLEVTRPGLSAIIEGFRWHRLQADDAYTENLEAEITRLKGHPFEDEDDE